MNYKPSANREEFDQNEKSVSSMVLRQGRPKTSHPLQSLVVGKGTNKLD